MTYLLAVLAGIAGAVTGYFLGAAIGIGIAPLLGISSFEGASGYFAAFATGPAGTILGLVLGPWLVLRYRAARRRRP
jgi:hypothetical protein